MKNRISAQQCTAGHPAGKHVICPHLEAVLEAYNAAADKFIAKVESGRARSVETYRDLTECRRLAAGLAPDASGPDQEKKP